MPAMLAVFLPLFAQAGVTPMPGNGPPINLPPVIERPEKRRLPGDGKPIAVEETRLRICLDKAGTSPATALDEAQVWLAGVRGSARVDPGQCLGAALYALGRWDEAARAFLAAREATASNEGAHKARLAGMAGNAALAGSDLAGAEADFAMAHADAAEAGESALAGDIAIDRSRALVGLNRLEEARAALDEGRKASPGNALGWLLSATLARREGDLAKAQGWIEQAATLDPLDPEIGLEAGLIAVLGGRDEAARKSWQSVLDTAPGSDPAIKAKGYLDQLGPPVPSPQ